MVSTLSLTPETLPNTASSRESTISPEGPRPRSDSWSPEFQLPTTASASFNPLLNLEDSFESSFEMSRTVEQVGLYYVMLATCAVCC